MTLKGISAITHAFNKDQSIRSFTLEESGAFELKCCVILVCISGVCIAKFCEGFRV